MGDGVGPIPSPLAQVDGLAQANGRDGAPDDPVQDCPRLWKLKVTVRSQETYWPKERFTVDLTGADSRSAGVTMNGVTSRERGFVGRGKKDFDVSATVDHWEVVATKKVQMTNGATKAVEIEIKAIPWVGFKLVNAKTKKRIKNATIKVDVKGPGKQDAVAAKGTAMVHDVDKTATKATVEAIEHADAWIYASHSESDEPIE